MSIVHALRLEGARTIAVCGAGGKTTLVYALARQAQRNGARVLVTTSTHMLQPEQEKDLRFFDVQRTEDVRAVLSPAYLSVFGTPCAQKKITGLSPVNIDDTMRAADLFVYEADGSKRLPLKCHNKTEPVIWFGTDAVICVLGLSALGQRADTVCHRWQLDPLFAAKPDKRIDTDDFIRLALECRRAAGYPHCFCVCLNQCDDPSLRTAVAHIAQQLAIHGIPCAASCFQSGQPEMIAL